MGASPVVKWVQSFRLGVCVATASLTGVLATATVLAQTPAPGPGVGPGERIRATTAAGRVDGILIAVGERTLTIRPREGAPDVTVPRAAITKLERVAGHRSRARYAGFGALLGLGGGALAGLASSAECKPSDWFCSAGFNAAAFGILGAGAGAVAGAILPPAPRWVEIDRTAVTEIPQEIPRPPPMPVRRWTTAFGTGAAWGGPRHDLEASMRQAGFDDTSPGFFGPPSPHPKSGYDVGSVWFDTYFQVRPPWDVGVTINRTSIGHTYGFHQPFQFLFVNYETTSVAVVVSRAFGPARTGVGPAWYSARSSEDHTGELMSHSRAGVVARAGLSLPVRTRLYLDLNLQYRYAGRAPVGPFTPAPVLGAPISFPETDAPFSHWFVGIGSGLRF